jgi:hypothetical protein
VGGEAGGEMELWKVLKNGIIKPNCRHEKVLTVIPKIYHLPKVLKIKKKHHQA